MKTVIHTYEIDTSRPDGAKRYAELCARLDGRHLMRTYSVKGQDFTSRDLDGREITIEPEFLFSDQWNTGPIDGISDVGIRAFDWYETIVPNESIRVGHWVEITPEMREARRNRHACGYCGKQEPAQKGHVFCDKCLDSPYLKESDLYLLRMQSVERGRDNRKPLSAAERDHLLPLYRDAQIHGSTERGKARIAKERADIIARAERKLSAATAERDGMIWLMDHGIATDNAIFYDHTRRFCFGWRSPLSDEIKSALLDVISEFPFPYDIKCADGRTLSGD